MRRFVERVRLFETVCLAAAFVVAFMGCGRQGSAAAGETASGKDIAGKAAAPLTMQKIVTEKAGFALYAPAGWKATETAEGNCRMLFVTDPGDTFGASMFVGKNPPGTVDTVSVAKRFVGRIGQVFPDLRVRNAWMSPDATRVVVDGAFTGPKGRREFRSWASSRGGEFSYLLIEAPEGRLEAMRPTLLTILVSVRVTKAGAGRVTEVAKVPLVEHRLKDGSVKVSVPGDWTFADIGKGCFIAADPSGQYAFMVSGAMALTGKGGVVAPGTPLSPYLVPSQAFRFFTGVQGLATKMQFLDVKPRPELARLMMVPGRTGAAHAEEFVYTYTNREGVPSKGYTFGVTTIQITGYTWGIWHMTVVGPADGFDAYAGNYAAMFKSYAGNEAWAKEYIARGNERLRQMDRETSAKIAEAASYCRQVSQAMYEERQKSQEYIDFRRTEYIRGESTWISEVEGGAVYHTNTWGTKNTWTDQEWQGKPYDYVNFEGKNPKHNEMMQPVDSRRLWEQHIRGR